MTNIALVGGGHIHTPGFIKMLAPRTDVKVTAVWDHQPGRAKARAEALNAAVIEDVARIWSDKSIEAVVICSETNLHEKLVLAAAAAGKHMFVEKPLGMGAADSYRMADAIEKAGVLFQTGYFRRGDRPHRFMRKLVQEGFFGKITRVRHSNCHTGSLGGWFDDKPDNPADSWRWMADPAQAGCGAFGDLGTHVLDILMWLFGDVASCTASINVVTGRYGDCDESGEGLLQFTSGVTGTFAAGWVDVADPVGLTISGTEGHAAIIQHKVYLTSKKIEGADGKTPYDWDKLPEGLPHAFELFLNAVTGQSGVELVTAREAAKRSAVMEALYAGAKQGAWVKPK
jgi:predicted dehydrogenase